MFHIPEPEDFKDYMDLLTFIVGAGAGAFALYQFWDGRRWKAAEFVAQEIQAFRSDANNVSACKMMDWTSGNTMLFQSDLGRIGSFPFTRETVVNALATKKPLLFSKEEEIVRDVFDAFFASLETIDGYIDRRNRLFDAKLLAPYLRYYLEIINQPDAFGATLRAFVDEYNYTGVRHLVTAVTGKAWRSSLSGNEARAPAGADESGHIT